MSSTTSWSFVRKGNTRKNWVPRGLNSRRKQKKRANTKEVPALVGSMKSMRFPALSKKIQNEM